MLEVFAQKGEFIFKNLLAHKICLFDIFHFAISVEIYLLVFYPALNTDRHFIRLLFELIRLSLNGYLQQRLKLDYFPDTFSIAYCKKVKQSAKVVHRRCLLFRFLLYPRDRTANSSTATRSRLTKNKFNISPPPPPQLPSLPKHTVKQIIMNIERCRLMIG